MRSRLKFSANPKMLYAHAWMFTHTNCKKLKGTLLTKHITNTFNRNSVWNTMHTNHCKQIGCFALCWNMLRVIQVSVWLSVAFKSNLRIYEDIKKWKILWKKYIEI